MARRHRHRPSEEACSNSHHRVHSAWVHSHRSLRASVRKVVGSVLQLRPAVASEHRNNPPSVRRHHPSLRRKHLVHRRNRLRVSRVDSRPKESRQEEEADGERRENYLFIRASIALPSSNSLPRPSSNLTILHSTVLDECSSRMTRADEIEQQIE